MRSDETTSIPMRNQIAIVNLARVIAENKIAVNKKIAENKIAVNKKSIPKNTSERATCR